MNVDIQALGFSITPALTAHAQRRLGFVLTRRSDRIRRVVVRLGDENGPRGGSDKFCRIQVYLADAAVAVIEQTGEDMYTVIDRATDRAGRTVGRHLDHALVSRKKLRRSAAVPNTVEPEGADDPRYN
jgi:putative sigma-54 modulation protein